MLQNKYKIMTLQEYDCNFAKPNYLIITSFFATSSHKNHHSGTTITDKLSLLPFSNALFTMHSAKEDEAKQEPES
jgi:hypothetical protein